MLNQKKVRVCFIRFLKWNIYSQGVQKLSLIKKYFSYIYNIFVNRYLHAIPLN